MADKLAIDWLDRYRGLAQRRDVWKTIWQSLADIFHPIRGTFTAELGEGMELSGDIYDSTPMQSRRDFATAIDAFTKSSSSRWFSVQVEDDNLNEVDENKRWFDTVQDRMWRAIYKPGARFVQQTNVVDNDLSTFGLGYLWTDENSTKSGLTFRANHIGSVVVDENSDGKIDTGGIARALTARQATQRWGEDKIGPKAREAFNSSDQKQRDKLFTFVQMVFPRHDRDVRMRDNKNMPFGSLVISHDDQTVVDESGYHEWPMSVPRWELVAGQVYPRSPGMLALCDARSLQAMGRTMLIAGEKAADPPLWAVDEGVISALRSYPGGVSIVDGNTVRDMRGPPIGAIEMGKNMPIGREMQQDYRQMVGNAFFRDVIRLPDDLKDITATAMMERKAQFLRTIAPALAQVEPDYMGTTIERVFNIMQRAYAFPPAPDGLRGQKVKFTFISPIQLAKRQIESMGLAQGFSILLPLVQTQPEALDNIDGDQIVRDMPEAFGFREQWLRPLAKVEAVRQGRQQAMAAQAALASAKGAADIGKTTADINQSLGQADALQQQGNAS